MSIRTIKYITFSTETWTFVLFYEINEAKGSRLKIYNENVHIELKDKFYKQLTVK